MLAAADPEPMSPAAVVANAICLPLGLITLVFLPVGRLDWKPGWIFIAFLVAAFGTSFLILARVNPSIYRARSRFQPGTKRWDLILVPLIFAAMITEVPLAAFDAGRMAWSSMPMAFVILGYALLGTGIALNTWAQAVNPFFEPGVRVQRERGQQFISKGPYAIVRHPGYVGALMIFAGMALSLASWWALIPAVLASLILIVRTKWEDDLLRTELEGYSEYAKRTRYRLFPHLW
jgi:protein-S-isoprenylcysteine O-methyltransferase Ste14